MHTLIYKNFSLFLYFLLIWISFPINNFSYFSKYFYV